MLVTELGMLISVRPHIENVHPIMLVIVFGRVMFFNLQQFEKAPSPMLVTEFGILILCNM